MNASPSPATTDVTYSDRPTPHASPPDLGRLIEHAAHLLPAQGPITVFIHHNTLHAFEDLPFAEGVRRGSEVFGCQPFLTEEKYRQALARGRIQFDGLKAVLAESLGGRAADTVFGTTTRFELRLAMLQYPLRSGPAEELHWFVAETDALRRVRPDASAAVRGRLLSDTRRWVMRDLRGGGAAGRLHDLFARFGEADIETWDDDTWETFALQALWRVACDGAARVPAEAAPPAADVRHRDLLLAATGIDTDVRVHELLIRFCAAFLDQGFARWPLPKRDDGFLRSFCAMYRRAEGPPDRWLRGLPAELARLDDGRVHPLDSVRESLDALGVPPSEWEAYVSATLLALRGWGGMIWQVEQRGDAVAHPIPKGSLVEFLAVRLVLERLAVAYAAWEGLGYTGPLSGVRDEARRHVIPPAAPGVEGRAFPVFQLAQVLGWTPGELHGLSAAGWAALFEELDAFGSLDRREVFQLAFERRLRNQCLDALALHAPKAADPVHTPRFQIVACLDEREESFRRHIEEVAPDAQTFGAAGFFAVPMYYRGVADANFVPLCPIVMQPKHWVCESVDAATERKMARVGRRRRWLGSFSHQFHVGSRSFAVGALLSAGVGVLASGPLIARVLFPRLAGRIRRAAGRVVELPPDTRLKLERKDGTPGPAPDQLGFSVDEMTAMAVRLLEDIGLLCGFSRLVFVTGHGSNSLNNPHKSAYDCGACGGSPGAPNGRALAQILNDPRIRDGLAAKGVAVPRYTWFVGGFHNTCNDSVELFDTDRVPDTHRAEFEAAKRDLDAACDRNAHERCRRFMSAPLTLSFPAARQHVEARSEDLAQTRPELGHATNALCFVGRRRWTRGLFFDRRMFLTSYDPTQDTADAAVLARTLGAVFPVCGGINLEYYFSHVDSPGYGCGTKLPHNVTSLLGVMDGAASDLRTGLPWQMVEIHEPVRLLIVCETTAEAMTGIMDRTPVVGNMARKGWVQLAVMDPQTAAIQVFHGGRFVPYRPEAASLPAAATSTDWYRGWRDHLEFAEIGC